jgi:hypothetical protein
VSQRDFTKHDLSNILRLNKEILTMNRQSRKPKNNRKQTAEQAKAIEESLQKENRRAFLLKVRNGAIVATLASGAGWYVAAEVNASVQEQDLSRIGNGIATVVQIHDPQCSLCAALQKETREAFGAFDDNELQYLVANIRSTEGRQFAAKHRVRHVTLLLFDAKGKRRDVLVGPNRAEDLERIFRRHIGNRS